MAHVLQEQKLYFRSQACSCTLFLLWVSFLLNQKLNFFQTTVQNARVGFNLYCCPCKNQCKQKMHRGASEFVDKNILMLLVTVLRSCFYFFLVPCHPSRNRTVCLPSYNKRMFSDASKLVGTAVFDIHICEFYMKSMLELMWKVNRFDSDWIKPFPSGNRP